MRQPEEEDVAKRVPQRRPVGGLEIERVNILVLLRRVLRVLDRAIGSMPEPLGMFVHPRMVGRGLKGDVERDGHPMSLRGGDKPIEIFERPEPRIDGRVTACCRANRPGTAWITGLR